MNNLNSQRAEILRQYNMSKPVNTIQSDLLKGTMSNLMNYSDKVGEQNNFNNMLALSQPDLDYYYETEVDHRQHTTGDKGGENQEAQRQGD